MIGRPIWEVAPVGADTEIGQKYLAVTKAEIVLVQEQAEEQLRARSAQVSCAEPVETPVSVVHWARVLVQRHSMASDAFMPADYAGCPVMLGDLRAWVRAVDEASYAVTKAEASAEDEANAKAPPDSGAQSGVVEAVRAAARTVKRP